MTNEKIDEMAYQAFIWARGSWGQGQYDQPRYDNETMARIFTKLGEIAKENAEYFTKADLITKK